MKTPLWLDISLHVFFTAVYALYYAKRHKWEKKYFIGSLLIIVFGILIDLDHRRLIEKFLKKISNNKISFELPKYIIHVCHTWQFATGFFIVSSVLFILGFKDLAVLIYASYFSHMLIDCMGKPGPNPSNLFPAKIHRFFRRSFL